MGIRITSNIFLGNKSQLGSRVSGYRHFKYQVMLLFSQHEHPELSESLHSEGKNGFAALDAYTGQNVVFFTCQSAKTLSNKWENIHQPSEADDRVLIAEIAQFF